MKKLALSLVLTLGVSGFALANNGNGEKEKQPERLKKTPTCFNQTVLILENSCGEYMGTISGEKEFTTCNEGQPEGFTNTTYKVFNSDVINLLVGLPISTDCI